MLWDFAILYLSVNFVQKPFAFSFSYPFFCLFFFLCIRDSWVSLSQSFMMFYYSKLWECMLQKLLIPTARIIGECNQTSPPGSGKSGCAGFGIFKRLWPLTNSWFRKQGATLANFILYYQKISVPKNLSLNSCIFIQMIRELFG